jgi:hypothetical protein
MKRPRAGPIAKRFGDIRKDLTASQLAALGAVALAYNEAEVTIDLLMVFALGLWATVAPEVSSRINGIDGKIEIAKVGMIDLGANAEIQEALSDSLGLDGFLKLKQYRDAVIHAHGLDVPSGIASTSIKRGKFYEVLLTEGALNGLYDRLVLMRAELIELGNIAISLSVVRKVGQVVFQIKDVFPPIVGVFDQTTAKIEQDIQDAMSRYRAHRSRRLSLPPLPEFPSEQELQQAHLQWLKDRQSDRAPWFLAFAEPIAGQRVTPADLPLVTIPPPPGKPPGG